MMYTTRCILASLLLLPAVAFATDMNIQAFGTSLAGNWSDPDEYAASHVTVYWIMPANPPLTNTISLSTNLNSPGNPLAANYYTPAGPQNQQTGKFLLNAVGRNGRWYVHASYCAQAPSSTPTAATCTTSVEMIANPGERVMGDFQGNGCDSSSPWHTSNNTCTSWTVSMKNTSTGQAPTSFTVGNPYGLVFMQMSPVSLNTLYAQSCSNLPSNGRLDVVYQIWGMPKVPTLPGGQIIGAAVAARIGLGGSYVWPSNPTLPTPAGYCKISLNPQSVGADYMPGLTWTTTPGL